MHSIYDVVVIGSTLLILYIIIDFIRKRTSYLIRRIVIYSFIFYLLNVAQLTTGGIVIPPRSDLPPIIQLIPFYFVWDWIQLYRINGFDWFFWNSVKLTFYNLLMLMPLGVYLSLLFKVKRLTKALLITFLVSLMIETVQITLTYLGFVMGRGFNMDDLIINTVGGVIGFVLIEFMTKIFYNIKFNTNTHKG